MLHVVADEKLHVAGLTERQKRIIKKKLTVTNPQWRSAVLFSGYNPAFIQIPKYITLYKDAGRELVLPRGFDLSAVVSGQKTVEHNYCTAPVKFPEPKIKLKSHQQVAYDHFVANYKTRPFRTYLDVLEVSAGKTILTAMIANFLNQRTLVLVHTKMIMDAWLSDLELLYGKEYRKEIGIIQGPKAFLGTHYTIAMTQTWFRRQQYWSDWFKEFGCLVVDECHLTPARTFTDCANEFPAKFRIGITGTPKRKDGLHKLMYQIFGTPFYEQTTTGEETETSLPISDVRVIDGGSRLPAYVVREIKYKVGGKVKKKFVKVPPDGERDYKLILDTIANDRNRTASIVNTAQRHITDTKGSVLVVTHRRKHAKRICQMMRVRTGKAVALLLGGMGKRRMNKFVRKLKRRKIRLAVATMQFIKTGASVPPLDLLIITTPIGSVQDLEQVTGRIRRKCVGKTSAVVAHYVDSAIPLCKRHFITKAIAFYRDKLKVARFKNTYIG